MYHDRYTLIRFPFFPLNQTVHEKFSVIPWRDIWCQTCATLDGGPMTDKLVVTLQHRTCWT